MLRALSTLLVIGGPPSAHHWSAAQIALAASAATALLVDHAQTTQALGEGWSETNPVLGAHPTRSALTTYTVAALIGMLGVGAALPDRWRTGWFALMSAVEISAVAGNARLGLHIGF
jgi:hypothetical protein